MPTKFVRHILQGTNRWGNRSFGTDWHCDSGSLSRGPLQHSVTTQAII